MNADRILVGTNWLKVRGRHFGQKGRIDSVTARGPKMKFIGRPVDSPHNRQQQFVRLDWNELGLTWMPDDKTSEDTYAKWSVGLGDTTLKVTVDKNLTVVKTEREVPKVPEEVTDMMIACESSYHTPKLGTVPASETRRTRRGRIMCNKCTDKMANYQSTKDRKVSADQTQPTWIVTVIQQTEHRVRAKDYLDAAAQFDGKGEVVKVEKL